MTWPLDLPPGQPQIFYCHHVGSPNTTGTVWVKPSGISCAFFFVVSAGAGGGGTAAAATTGASGGSAGTVTKLLVPAAHLPEYLEIRTGQGGAGGTNANGTDATNTLFVSHPNRTTLATFSAGNGGISTGAAPSQPAVLGDTSVWPNFVYKISVAGGAAGAGGTLANNGANSTAGIITGGGGGSGAGVVNGGASTGSFGYPNAAGAVSATSGPGSGYTIFTPLFLSVGGGGGCAGEVASVDGGVGGIGCGGGGGAAGATIVANTTGGRGGNGITMVWSW